MNDRRKRSVMGSASAVRSRGVTPEQQIESRMCPFECVGTEVCCWHPKLSKPEGKSLVRGRLILSTWMLKSPNSIMFVWCVLVCVIVLVMCVTVSGRAGVCCVLLC